MLDIILPPISYYKSFTFTSQGIGSGTYYIAGYYKAPAADANLSQASATQTLGNVDVPYAAHAFLVAGGAGSASGGSGTVEIEVSGTSIDDEGTRTTSDTEIIVANITAMSVNGYSETIKKWIGQVTFTLQNSSGSTQTTFNADFNYGLCKYDDFGNSYFVVTNLDVVGLASANDSSFNVRLLHHSSAGWTYHATAFSPGGTEIANMSTDHSTENSLDSGEYFAYKRSNIAQEVKGSSVEGIVIEIVTGQPNSIQMLDAHVGIRPIRIIE